MYFYQLSSSIKIFSLRSLEMQVTWDWIPSFRRYVRPFSCKGRNNNTMGSLLQIVIISIIVEFISKNSNL